MAAITIGQLALGKKALGQHARNEALISAAFPKEFEPPHVGSYKEWSFSTGC
jgi:hypothetical protein